MGRNVDNEQSARSLVHYPGVTVESLLTSREVAEILRVSPATLSRWRDRNVGPAWSDFYGMPRYELETVARWVQDQRHDG